MGCGACRICPEHRSTQSVQTAREATNHPFTLGPCTPEQGELEWWYADAATHAINSRNEGFSSIEEINRQDAKSGLERPETPPPLEELPPKPPVPPPLPEELPTWDSRWEWWYEDAMRYSDNSQMGVSFIDQIERQVAESSFDEGKSALQLLESITVPSAQHPSSGLWSWWKEDPGIFAALRTSSPKHLEGSNAALDAERARDTKSFLEILKQSLPDTSPSREEAQTRGDREVMQPEPSAQEVKTGADREVQRDPTDKDSQALLKTKVDREAVQPDPSDKDSQPQAPKESTSHMKSTTLPSENDDLDLGGTEDSCEEDLRRRLQGNMSEDVLIQFLQRLRHEEDAYLSANFRCDDDGTPEVQVPQLGRAGPAGSGGLRGACIPEPPPSFPSRQPRLVQPTKPLGSDWGPQPPPSFPASQLPRLVQPRSPLGPDWGPRHFTPNIGAGPRHASESTILEPGHQQMEFSEEQGISPDTSCELHAPRLGGAGGPARKEVASSAAFAAGPPPPCLLPVPLPATAGHQSPREAVSGSSGGRGPLPASAETTCGAIYFGQPCPCPEVSSSGSLSASESAGCRRGGAGPCGVRAAKRQPVQAATAAKPASAPSAAAVATCPSPCSAAPAAMTAAAKAAEAGEAAFKAAKAAEATKAAEPADAAKESRRAALDLNLTVHITSAPPGSQAPTEQQPAAHISLPAVVAQPQKALAFKQLQQQPQQQELNLTDLKTNLEVSLQDLKEHVSDLGAGVWTTAPAPPKQHQPLRVPVPLQQGQQQQLPEQQLPRNPLLRLPLPLPAAAHRNSSPSTCISLPQPEVFVARGGLLQVSLSETDGLPEKALLSCKLGSVRRQQPVSALRQSLTVLSLPLPEQRSVSGSAQPLTLGVSLLRPLAEGSLVLHPHCGRYSLQLTPDCSGDMIGLELGVSGHRHLSSGASEVAGDILMQEPSKDRADCQHSENAAMVKGFMDRHHLVQYVTSLVEAVCREQPAEPYAFMKAQIVALDSITTACAAEGVPKELDSNELPLGLGSEASLELLSADGLPQGSLLSVRCGAHRRQATVSSMLTHKQRLKLSKGLLLEVQVFAPEAATKLQITADKQLYRLRLRGGAMTMTLRASMQQDQGCLAPAGSVAPSSACAGAVAGDVGIATCEAAVAEYLAKHGLLFFVRELMRDLAEARPQEPFAFVAERLRVKHEEAAFAGNP